MSVQDLGISVDTVWMLLAAMLVFFMQPGFALCEAGFTRSKNTANILFKNFVDFMVGSVLFWFVGLVLPSFQVLWQNVPSSPCIASIHSSSH